MRRILAAVVFLLCSALAASAADSTFVKPAGRARRSVMGRRAAARSVSRGAYVVHNGVGAGFAAPNYAGSGVSYMNGRPMSSVRSGGAGGTVRPLRGMTAGSGSNSTSIGGPMMTRGYGASTPGASAPGNFKPGSIHMDGKGRTLAGPGVTQGQADTPPGGGSSANSGQNFMNNILNGLANMFGDMASMLGGGG